MMPKVATASDPKISCWVNASAGTGKTKLLIDRLLRLLLQEVNPSKILCITFTKAAAKEILERLHHKLQNWMIMGEEPLQAELSLLTEQHVNQNLCDFARTLFLCLLDHPSGVNIKTIHGFCQNLLQIFPIEAGLIPGFEIIDDAEQKNVQQYAFEQTCQQHDAQIFLNELVQFYNHQQLFDLLTQIPAKFHRINTSTQAKELQEFFNKKKLNPNINLDLLGKINLQDEVHQTKINQFIHQQDNFDEIKNIFLTKSNTIRKKINVTAPKPELIKEIAENFFQYQFFLNQQENLAKTNNFFCLWHLFYNNYQQIKKNNNGLDYDDLIIHSVNLLKNTDLTPWVAYKLDGWIEHILVDESQDTSVTQWEVIMALLHDNN